MNNDATIHSKLISNRRHNPLNINAIMIGVNGRMLAGHSTKKVKFPEERTQNTVVLFKKKGRRGWIMVRRLYAIMSRNR